MRDNKIYIFGHRGASGYCIENTLKSFKTACEMNANIETDIRLTKDNVLVAFHDPGVKIDNTHYKIKNLTLKELRNIDFEDGRKIPTLEDLFECFSDHPDLKFSLDIGSEKAGVELIKMAGKYSLLENVYITDTRIKVLHCLRKCSREVNLVHTIPHRFANLEKYDIDVSNLKKNDIKILNIKANRYYKENFAVVLNNGFNCFFWSVNTKIRMKHLMKMEINGSKIHGIYTDYPDEAVSLCKDLY